jgi:hypothetical protein
VKQLLQSAETVQQELGDNQELFWTGDDYNLSNTNILHKVRVNFGPKASLEGFEFVCRYSAPYYTNHGSNKASSMSYNQHTLSFQKLPAIVYSPASCDDHAVHTSDQPLKALDLFAGTGGFAYACCLAAGHVQVVDAVDNNPSASCTLQYDFIFLHHNRCLKLL